MNISSKVLRKIITEVIEEVKSKEIQMFNVVSDWPVLKQSLIDYVGEDQLENDAEEIDKDDLREAWINAFGKEYSAELDKLSAFLHKQSKGGRQYFSLGEIENAVTLSTSKWLTVDTDGDEELESDPQVSSKLINAIKKDNDLEDDENDIDVEDIKVAWSDAFGKSFDWELDLMIKYLKHTSGVKPDDFQGEHLFNINDIKAVMTLDMNEWRPDESSFGKLNEEVENFRYWSV